MSSNSYTYTLPEKSGTLATLDDCGGKLYRHNIFLEQLSDDTMAGLVTLTTSVITSNSEPFTADTFHEYVFENLTTSSTIPRLVGFQGSCDYGKLLWAYQGENGNYELDTIYKLVFEDGIVTINKFEYLLDSVKEV